MRVWPMPCVPRNVPSPYCSETWVASPRSLISSSARAERQHLGALDLLDVGGEPPRVAGIAQAIAEGIRRGFGDLDGLGADLGEHPVDLGLPLPDLLADVVVLGHVLLLGELESHDIFVGRSTAP